MPFKEGDKKFLERAAVSEGLHVGHNRNVVSSISSREHGFVIGTIGEMLDMLSHKIGEDEGHGLFTADHVDAYSRVFSLKSKMNDEEMFAVAVVLAKKNPKTFEEMDKQIGRLSNMDSEQRLERISEILKIPKKELMRTIRQIRSLA